MATGEYDVIVVGSGIGGLTVASLLAQMAGRRVLILERHFKAGGFTHTFARNGYTWDVGLHYVGGMHERSASRALFDFITGSGVRWQKMPRVYDRFVYPDISFAVADNPETYMRDLIAAFPAEARAIRRYFRDLEVATGWLTRHIAAKAAPGPMAALMHAANVLASSGALITTQAYLDRHFRDARLKALLVSQWGDYGLPPGQSAFAIHALIATHYMRGGYYPVGGAAVIAEAILPIVERAGGACLLNHRVTEILIEHGVATGVRVLAGAGTRRREATFTAPVIISDAGAYTTLVELLPGVAVGPRLRRELEATAPSMATVTLYLGLKDSPAALGFAGENHWLFSGNDHNAMARDPGLLEGRAAMCYLSFPSMKDPGARRHTAEVIAPLDYALFARWKDRPWRRRGEAYEAAKNRISEALLDMVERRYPGFRALVAYQELSTPLTVEGFTGHRGGGIYGVPATPQRLRRGWFHPRTPVRNLWLSGADVGSLGIMGAAMGGVVTASLVMGRAGFIRIMAASQRHAARHGASHAAPAPVPST